MGDGQIDVGRDNQLPFGVNPGDDYVLFDSRSRVGVIVRPNYMHLIEDGRLVGEGEWFNGRREGFWRFYHENGQLSYDGEYRSGRLEGLSTLYSAEGQVIGKFNMRAGELHGECILPKGKGSNSLSSGLYEYGVLVDKYEDADTVLGASD